MKKIIISVFVIVVALQSGAQFTKASLQASGLTCAMCSKAVKSALEKVEFVQEVKVDIKNQQYNMVFKKDVPVSFDELKKAVEDAGFSVASLKVTGNFDDLRVKKDKHIQVGNQTFHFLNGDNEVLNGEKTLTIVDKNFLTAKSFKKYSAASDMKCVQTGRAADCCAKDGIVINTRIYHVII
jgi:copper chaperone CopZ